MNHKFDWHDAPTFLQWLLPTAMGDSDDFEHLADITDAFSKCELGITLNGVALDAEKFLNAVSETMDAQTRRHARVLVDNLVDFEGLNDMVLSLQNAMDREIRKRLDAAGISISEWNN